MRRWRRLLVEKLELRICLAGMPIANIPVNTDPGVQQMPSVAVDPLNSKHVVIAYLDYSLVNPGYTGPNGYAGIGTQESLDGGKTWLSEVPVPLPRGFSEGAGNPIVQFNAQGQVFVSFMAVTFKGKVASALASGDFEDRGAAGITSNNGIFEARSDDGGKSWDPAVAIVSHVYNGSTLVFFEDLPQLAIDTSPTSPNFGDQYEVWTRVYPPGQFPNEPNSSGGTDIMIAVSKDDGQTWQVQYHKDPDLAAPVTAIDDSQNDITAAGGGTGTPLGQGFVDQPHVTVGPDGSVYVAYFAGGDFAVAYSPPSAAGSYFLLPDYKSTDRVAFGNDDNVFVNESGIGSGDLFRTFPVREIVADPTRPGTVYAVSTISVADANGNTIDPADVIFARSTDYGLTWTSSFEVGGVSASVLNDDNGGQKATGLSTDVIDGQTQPRLAVDNDGNISVIWYDTRRDPAGQDLDVFGTTSTDGGRTFSSNFRVTSQSFDPSLGAFKNPTTQPGGPVVTALDFATGQVGPASGQLNYYLGDFPGLAMANGTIYAAWTDTRNSRAGSMGNQDIYFASYAVSPAPAAPIERYAPNNTAKLATNLGTHTELVVPKLALPAGYEEWFQVVAAASGTLTISAASIGDIALAVDTLDLQLYDDTGTNLLASGSDLDNAAGNFIGQSLAYAKSTVGESFLVRVFRSNSVDTTPTQYDLSLQSLTADLGTQVVVDQPGTIAAGGEAVYKLTAAATGSLQLQFTQGANVQGNLSVDVEDPNTSASLIPLPRPPPTVAAPEPNFSIGEADPTGLDGPGSAELQGVIGNGIYSQTTGDYDFYSLKAGSGQKIVVNLNPTVGSPLDGVIALYGSAGNPLQPFDNPNGLVVDDNGPGVPETLTYITARAGTYYVVVYASNNGDALPKNPFIPGGGGAINVPSHPGAYSLTITIQPVGPGTVQQFNIPVQQGQTVLLKVTGDGASSGAYELGIVNLDQFTTTDITSLVFPAGAGPSQVAADDLTGDGKPDLVVTNALSNTVSVLLNNGDGTFQAPQQYAVGSFKTPSEAAAYGAGGLTTYRRPVVLADLDNRYYSNHQPIYDIVVANYDSGDISVLMNRGNGTFQPQLRFDTGSTPFGLAIGDLSGNGIPDVVTIDSRIDNLDFTVSVLMGNGDGTFRPARTFDGGIAGTYPLSTVTLADLNNDGKLDLIISGGNNFALEVLLGNGDGTFQNAQTYKAGRLGSSVLVVPDGNNNGTFDPLDTVVGEGDAVVVPGSNASSNYDIINTALDFDAFSVLLGNGDGTFTADVTPPTNLPVLYPAGQEPTALGWADFGSQVTLPDGSLGLGPPDGHPDLIAADSGGAASDASEGPPGIFVVPTLWNTQDQFTGFGSPVLLSTAIDPQDMALAYLTGDDQGVPDVIVADQDGVRVIYGKAMTISPNDTRQTARNLGTVVHLEQQTLTIVPGHEDDYYTLTVPTEAVTSADEILDFSALFQDEAESGDLGMEVLDDSGKVLASGERFSLAVPQGETLTVHIFGETATSAGAYTLDIDTLPQAVSAQAQPLLPGPGGQPGGPTASLVVTLQGDRLDPVTAQNPNNYVVTWSGPDGVFGTADDQVLPPPTSVVYDPSTNVEIESGTTYPTAVKQTVTLVYDQPLQPGTYQIDLSPQIQTAAFNPDEINSLAGGTAILGGHTLVSLNAGAIHDGAQVTATVEAPGSAPDFSLLPSGSPFLTQLHDDLGALLDFELTQYGAAHDANIPNTINQEIANRVDPALGPAGKQPFSLLVIWLDPRSFSLESPQNGIFSNLPGSANKSLAQAFVYAAGNIDLVVAPLFPGTTYTFTVAGDSPTVRGAALTFGGNGPQTTELTTAALRSGQTVFYFGSESTSVNRAVTSVQTPAQTPTDPDEDPPLPPATPVDAAATTAAVTRIGPSPQLLAVLNQEGLRRPGPGAPSSLAISERLTPPLRHAPEGLLNPIWKMYQDLINSLIALLIGFFGKLF
ncbi:MAG: FG-GAP-like repeat-containing protein [Thermoguttaceae bacterium]